mgnify:CR=1 FL=1
MDKREKQYFFKTKFIKMGRWNVSPADSETWHDESSSRYFKKVFGITKGTLIIQDLAGNYQHAYFPKSYFKKLFARITQINSIDYKNLSKILLKFYAFKKRAIKGIAAATVKNFSNISKARLLNIYKANRDWVHQAAVYDQFGWIGDEYWKPYLEKILTKDLKVKKNSPEYYRVLFTLTKP